MEEKKIYKRPQAEQETPAPKKTQKTAAKPAAKPETKTQAKTQTKKKKRERSGGGASGCLVVFLVLLLLLVIVVGSGYFIITRDMNGLRKGSNDETEIEVVIPQGSSTTSVCSILKEYGIISHPNVFKYYSIFKNYQNSYMYGTHEFTKGMSYEEIATELKEVTIEQVPTITETFPEGKTAYAMALQLERDGLCTVDEFIFECNHGVFDVSFFNLITENSNKFIKLDGFLFPDTYDFPETFTAHDIIQMMLENFEKKVWTPETQAKVAASGRTLEENIIMASIVEKETLQNESDQNIYAMVASVFLNRLNNPSEFPTLESDTSTAHLYGNFIYGVLGYYYNGDTEPYERNIPKGMVDAYDTYVTPGIIVGAICNPGIEAINGVLEPADTPYYFVLTDDANNYYWGTTASEHNANIAEANRVNAQVANGTYVAD